MVSLETLPTELVRCIFDHLDEVSLYPLSMVSTFTRQNAKRFSLARLQTELGMSGISTLYCIGCAEYGYLDLLQWILDFDHFKTRPDLFPLNIELTCAASRGGNLALLKWLREEKKCPWDPGAFTAAAQGGHIHIIKWLKENKCPANPSTVLYAAHYGHLPLLQYLFETDPDLTLDASIFSEAAKGGQIEILEWTWSKRSSFSWVPFDVTCCSSAASNGSLECLKWLREKGFGWDPTLFSIAAKQGHLHIIKWAHENGCKWEGSMGKSAALYGHLEILKYARANGCPWNDRIPVCAILGGHLEILKWARENGYEWSEEVTLAAVSTANLEVLVWLKDNGAPLSSKLGLLAANKGHFVVLKWIIENRINELTSWTMSVLVDKMCKFDGFWVTEEAMAMEPRELLALLPAVNNYYKDTTLNRK